MADMEIPPVRPDGLQLQENRRYQEFFWRAERCAWVLFAAIVVAAMLGATGSGGPLARRQVTVGGGAIDVPRIARWEAAETMTVRFATAGGLPTLRLSPRFAQSLDIETVQPRPERVETSASGQTFHFAVGERPAKAAIRFRPKSPGLVRYEAAIGDAAPVRLTTLVLP